MKTFIEIVKAFLIALGVIFFFIILGLIWFFVADPWEIKPLIPSLIGIEKNLSENQEPIEAGDHPLLSNEQENTLKKIGIDPASLPTEITPEMQACFTKILGAERVAEIIKTGSPSPLDMLKAKSCL
jgi:hypothetical protein